MNVPARALPTKKGRERVNVRTQAREPRSARTESSGREVGWGGRWGEGGGRWEGSTWAGGRRGEVAGADLRSKLLDALVCVRQFFPGLVQARPQLAVFFPAARIGQTAAAEVLHPACTRESLASGKPIEAAVS